MQQLLLLLSLSATDILIGVDPLGIFWLMFSVCALSMPICSPTQLTAAPSTLFRTLLLVFAGVSISVALTGVSRITTIGYGLLFFCYGFWILCAHERFDRFITARALQWCLALYFFSAAAAKLVISLGLSGYDTFLLTRYWTDWNSGESRPIGFTSEPSYAAFIVAFAWIGLIRLGALRIGASRSFYGWTFLTIASLYLFGSIFGYILGITVLFVACTIQPQRRVALLLIALTIVGCVWWSALPADVDDSRSLRIFNAILSANLDNWYQADNSSFFRIGPLLSYIAEFDPGSTHFWLGHGAASASTHFADIYRADIAENKEGIELGFIPAFAYDYGIISFFAFFGFLYRITKGLASNWMRAMLFMLCFNANFSTQLLWFAVTCSLLTRPAVIRPASLLT